MTASDKERRQAPWIVLGIGIALLIALIVFAIVPHQNCPRCGGFTIAHNERTVRGLPDASGLSPCSRCEGRSTVSRLNLWLNGDAEAD